MSENLNRRNHDYDHSDKSARLLRQCPHARVESPHADHHLVVPKHAGVGAFVACLRTVQNSVVVAGVVGNTSVVVQVSCSHQQEGHAACCVVVVASVGHRRVIERRHRRQHHSHCQRVQVH